MAFSLRGQGEINVTPLIDVLLVLLVIFLIVMPRTMAVEEIEVPRRLHHDEGEPPPTLIVTVRADLSVMITDDDLEITLPATELTLGLRQHLSDETHVVFVEFDDAVLWDQVVTTIDSVRSVAPTAQVALKVRD